MKRTAPKFSVNLLIGAGRRVFSQHGLEATMVLGPKYGRLKPKMVELKKGMILMTYTRRCSGAGTVVQKIEEVSENVLLCRQQAEEPNNHRQAEVIKELMAFVDLEFAELQKKV